MAGTRMIRSARMTPFLLLPLLLMACQATSLRFGFSQRSSEREMSLRYGTFTATEEKRQPLEAGDTLVLTYDVVVTKGTLMVAVLDPGENPVWEITLREDASDRIRIPIAESGAYTIRFRGEDTGGQTNLSWTIET